MQQTNFAYEEFRCKNRQDYIIIIYQFEILAIKAAEIFKRKMIRKCDILLKFFFMHLSRCYFNGIV